MTTVSEVVPDVKLNEKSNEDFNTQRSNLYLLRNHVEFLYLPPILENRKSPHCWYQAIVGVCGEIVCKETTAIVLLFIFPDTVQQ